MQQVACGESGDNITNVLMASPETEDEASTLGWPPIAHDGCVDLTHRSFRTKKGHQFIVRKIKINIIGDIFNRNFTRFSYDQFSNLTGPPVAWNAPWSIWQVKKNVPQTAALEMMLVDAPNIIRARQIVDPKRPAPTTFTGEKR